MAQTVKELMTPSPVVVDAGTAVVECAKLMERREIGALGVVREGRLVGVLTDRDIVVRAVARARDPSTTPAGQISTPEVVSVTQDAALEDAERRMTERAVRRLFVVADDGTPVGILTQDDLTAFRFPDSVAAQQIGEWGLARGDMGYTGQGE